MSKNELSIALNALHPISGAYRNFFKDPDFPLKKTIRKNDMLLMPGMDTEPLIHIARGSCKIYWLDNDNEEHIFMILPNGALISFSETLCIGQQNTDLHIRMLEDSEVWVLSGAQMKDIYAAYPESLIHQKMIFKQLTALRDKHVLMLMKKERDRYAYFIKEFHDIYRMQLPEKELCRFLNICRRTLSICKTNWLLKDRRRR